MRFNVVGYLTSGTGLGRMACDLIRALSDSGHEVVGLDIDAGEKRRYREMDLSEYFRPASEMFRDGVDLLVFPVSGLGHMAKMYRFGSRQVAVPLWELPDIHPQWKAQLAQFDGLVACSDFIADTLTAHGLAVWRAPHPHYIGQPEPDRKKFGLPEDQFLFLFTFDPSSDVSRKNPAAVVRAFQMADVPGTHLVIKINTSDHRSQALEDWLESVPSERVTIVTQYQSHAEVVQLIASCDVYVSLHRGEGLGLGMLEAMQLGKPVIATGWSGNMSFMDSNSACLVDYTIVPVQSTIPVYLPQQIGKRSQWADPSVEHAARWMRFLAGNEVERAEIGQRARQAAEAYQAVARRVEWVEHLRVPVITIADSADVIKRLLIFTPTWIDPTLGVAALHSKCRAAIEAQRMSAEMTWEIGLDNPYPIPDHRNVLHQYQQARALFLAGDYDALLTIEHDNVLQDEDAVERLINTPGDVVYAPYTLRHGLPMLSTWQYINDRNLGMSLTNYPEELRHARIVNVYRVSGAGFGCTLIRRRVLEAIEFTGRTDRDQNACPDLRFAEDCLRKHFVSNGRFDVPVLHWDGSGWLNPYQNRSNGMAMYLPLEDMNAKPAGRFLRLIKDEPIELTDDEAKYLSALGVIVSASDVAPQAGAPRGEMTVPTVSAEVPEVEIVPPARRNRAKTLKRKA